MTSSVKPMSTSFSPTMILAASLARGMPIALETEGDGAAGAGVHFDDVKVLHP